MIRTWLLLGLTLGLGMGQAQSWVQELLKHPSLQSASLQVKAAQAQINAQNSPVTVGGTAGFQSSDYIDSNSPVIPKDSSVWDVRLQAAFMLFPYGATADQLAQAQISLQQAQLGFRAALTSAEVQVMTLAYQLQLARQGRELARTAEQLALKSLEVARLRASKGGISPAELRDAETAYQQAQEQLKTADENVRLAELNLNSWVGGAQVQVLEPLRFPASRLSAEQQRALLGLEQTRIQVEGIKRRFIPTLNASYNQQLDDSHIVGVEMSSSDLQPRLNYKYQSGTTKALNSQLTLSLTFAVTPTIGEALGAADAQLAAAEATVKNAALTREIQEAGLKLRHEQALRALALRTQAVNNATLSLSEAQKREELGLSSPLQTLKAILDLSQAQLAEQQARMDVLSRVLDAYQFYALPPIEVNP